MAVYHGRSGYACVILDTPGCLFLVCVWKFHSTSVPCLKEKAQIITDVPELIRYGPGLLEDDSDMPLATLAAVKEASSPSRIDLCHI